MVAVIEDSWQAVEKSVRDAATDQGPPLEAMTRLVAAMVDVGDRLLFLFGDPRASEGRERPKPDVDPVLALIKRGQAEGVFDRQIDAIWIRSVLWGLVYTGCAGANEAQLPRHGVAPTVTRILFHGIDTTPASN
ncbi:hypothetical protein [Fodinicola feengrottensis]|uniref:hypothetical protein n=1 Tax=Fodinicola feengrottensis TaxID=435914 RepID=UPI0024417635|nr:hypothetical protein [Fodinicola feengrottensis]